MSDSFVLDNWMVRFLMEHSSNLSERQMPGLQSPEDSIDKKGLPSAHMEVAGTYGLLDLLQDQEVTSTALVNHAIDWLLE